MSDTYCIYTQIVISKHIVIFRTDATQPAEESEQAIVWRHENTSLSLLGFFFSHLHGK